MMHIAQAVETGKSGISVVLDAGIVGLIVTNGGLLIKAIIDRKVVKAALDVATKATEAKGAEEGVPKPGESATCRAHGETLAGLVQFKDTAGTSLERIEGKVDRLLERK